MLRGRISSEPCPCFWVDWRVLVPDLSLAMRLMCRVVEDTVFFDRAVRKLPVKSGVLRWFARNHRYSFSVVVIGEQTGCLDQLLNKRLKSDWVQHVYWSPSVEHVREEMKTRPWVAGFLTADKLLVSPENYFFLYTGTGMNLRELPITPDVLSR